MHHTQNSHQNIIQIRYFHVQRFINVITLNSKRMQLLKEKSSHRRYSYVLFFSFNRHLSIVNVFNSFIGHTNQICVYNSPLINPRQNNRIRYNTRQLREILTAQKRYIQCKGLHGNRTHSNNLTRGIAAGALTHRQRRPQFITSKTVCNEKKNA